MSAAGLADVQAGSDARGVAVARAGIAGLAAPVRFVDGDGAVHACLARVTAWVAVPPERRGAHMSRLAEAVGAWEDEELTLAALAAWAAARKEEQDSTAAGVRLAMTWLLRRPAPASGRPSWIDYQVAVSAGSDGNGERLAVTVEVPVTTLCPCSKEVAAAGAHSQRSLLRADLGGVKEDCGIAELAAALEGCASARLDAVLKREDEKHVTEEAYARPRFAEDVVRDAALLLRDADASSWQARVRNLESIHNHDAFAEASSRGQPPPA